jgi:hypothetical protein
MRPGEGVLQSVRRIGSWLSLSINHEGQEVMGGVELEPDQEPLLDAIEKVLKANVGMPIKDIGDLDV